MNTWPDFYKSRVCSERYQRYVEKRYAPFIEVIKMLMWIRATNRPEPITIHEVGCGIGTITTAIYNNFGVYEFAASDNNLVMLENTGTHFMTMTGAPAQPYNMKFLVRNVLGGNIDRADIFHSHGLLEHFDEADISRIISYMNSKCAAMVHYVPTDKYKTPSFGDERLWPVEKWQDICQPDRVETFNDDHDLMMIWDKKI